MKVCQAGQIITNVWQILLNSIIFKTINKIFITFDTTVDNNIKEH